MRSLFVYRCGLSIAVVLLLIHTSITPGVAQPSGKSDCYRSDRQELTPLKMAGRRVSRQQTKLTIKTKRRSIVFQDVCDAYQEQATTYTLESYFPDINYFLVHRASYEDGDYTLINGKTGVKTTLRAAPVFSPNRQRFASMTIDEMNGYTSVYVYRINSTGVKVEYRDNDRKWMPTDPKWRNNDVIEFTHNFYNGDQESVQILLKRQGQSWIVTKNPGGRPVAK
jgi:hypothetical protein